MKKKRKLSKLTKIIMVLILVAGIAIPTSINILKPTKKEDKKTTKIEKKDNEASNIVSMACLDAYSARTGETLISNQCNKGTEIDACGIYRRDPQDIIEQKSYYYRYGWRVTNADELNYLYNDCISIISSNPGDELHMSAKIHLVKETYLLHTSNNSRETITLEQNEYRSLANYVDSKTGYNFTGWYTAASGGTRVTEVEAVREYRYVDLYSQFTPQQYTNTLNYNASGGTGAPSAQTETVTYPSTSSTFSLSSVKPTRTGYTFNGWYTAASGGSAVGSTVTVGSRNNAGPQSLTVYAQWTAKQSTVYFAANGGSVSTGSKTVTYDSTYGTLPTPTKTGYTFKGWFTAGSGGTQITASSKVAITSDTTLYAQWTAATPTVTFNANGGAATNPASKTVTYELTYGDLPTSTKTGYTFKGWFTSTTSTEQIVSSSKVNKYSNHTLYAQWTANNYTVSFDSNGGSAVAAKTVTYDSTYGTLTTPTKTGYTFKGWYTSKDYSTQVTSSTTVAITSAQTLYAKWEATTYTVTFTANGGSSSSSIKVTYAGTYGTLPTPTKTGYDFAGWYTESTGGSQVTANTQVTTASNHTLYAHWTPKKYKLIYDANGGNPVASKDIYYQEPYGELAVPVRGGYQFIGWYTTATSTTLVTSDNKHTKTSDITVYAHWRERTYTVTFDSQGGSSANNQEVKYNQVYSSLPGSTRKGYTFDGWYTDPKAGNRVTASSTVTAIDNFTLYAHWTPNNYTITFNGNGGSATLASSLVTFANSYGTLPTASRNRYVFDGWYTESTGGTKVESSTVVSTASNHTLYAHWISKELVVTFDSQGGRTSSQTQTFYQDETYANIIEPIRPGYTFGGWVTSLTNGTKIDSNTTVPTRGKQTLYATWNANKYTVNFDADEGTLSTLSKEVTYDGTYGELPTPTKTGSTFKGWFTEKVGGTKVESTTKVTIASTQTLYAHWKTEVINENEKTVTRTEVSNPTPTSEYESEEGVEVYDENGQRKDPSKNVGTGDFVKKPNGVQYRVIIVGDMNGDGKVSTADYVKLWNHLDRNNKNKLTKDYHLLASDINQDGKVSTADYVKLWKLLKR